MRCLTFLSLAVASLADCVRLRYDLMRGYRPTQPKEGSRSGGSRRGEALEKRGHGGGMP